MCCVPLKDNLSPFFNKALYKMLAVSQLFLIFDANYLAPSPSQDPQAPPSWGSLAVPQEASVCAGLPGRPVVPSPRSPHRPSPWFPGQRHRDTGFKYQSWGGGWGRGVDTRGGDREGRESVVAQMCPGAVTPAAPTSRPKHLFCGES